MKKFNCFKDKCIYYLGMLLIALAIFMILTINYLLWIDGTNVIKYNGPMKIVSISDSQIEVLLDYCKYEDRGPVTVYISYVDGIVYSLHQRHSPSLELGCHTVHKIYELPKALPDGPYHLEVTTVMNINVLKTKSYVWRTEEFNIDRIEG